MVTTSLSERRGAGPGRSKACWIMADPFIVSSTMVKMVVRTVALSSICSTLLVCLSCLQTEVYYRSLSLSATSTKRIYSFHHRELICSLPSKLLVATSNVKVHEHMPADRSLRFRSVNEQSEQFKHTGATNLLCGYF